jgi:invasion protein IalB
LDERSLEILWVGVCVTVVICAPNSGHGGGEPAYVHNVVRGCTAQFPLTKSMYAALKAIGFFQPRQGIC